MTGYGRGVAEHEGVRATVEVRAVNHRFLDLKLRGASIAPATEEAITARVRGAVERGSVAVSVHLQSAGATAGVRIDAEAARRAYDMLAETATRLGLAGPDLALVLAQPGVIVAGEDGGEVDPPVLAALDAALAQLDQMRAAEGDALAAELRARLDELSALRTTIAGLAATLPQAISKRLHDRVKRLLESSAAGSVDQGRLAQEVALLADRADVTEELVRLLSHVDQMRALLTTKAAAGRRLDFLVQEIGRELNTIGSKSTLAEISAAVVEGKAVLEKVREQVQNVE
jgi:uncharacterized protein (TIGR00255 family)